MLPLCLEEDAVVQLAQAEELENLARLRRDLVDTGNADAEDELRLRLHEELPGLLGRAAHADQVLLRQLVP